MDESKLVPSAVVIARAMRRDAFTVNVQPLLNKPHPAPASQFRWRILEKYEHITTEIYSSDDQWLVPHSAAFKVTWKR